MGLTLLITHNHYPIAPKLLLLDLVIDVIAFIWLAAPDLKHAKKLAKLVWTGLIDYNRFGALEITPLFHQLIDGERKA